MNAIERRNERTKQTKAKCKRERIEKRNGKVKVDCQIKNKTNGKTIRKKEKKKNANSKAERI